MDQRKKKKEKLLWWGLAGILIFVLGYLSSLIF